jgi:hypothetical protein
VAFIDELGALIDKRLTNENREEIAGALDREAYRLDRAAGSELPRKASAGPVKPGSKI